MYILSNGIVTVEVEDSAAMLEAANTLQTDRAMRVTIQERFADGSTRWLVAPEGEAAGPSASVHTDTVPPPQAPATIPVPAVAVQANSDFSGNLVTDETARVRIEGQHEALRQAGYAVDTSKQLYKTATRMADIGYANQNARHVEHEQKEHHMLAMSALSDRVISEKRREYVISAGDLAKSLKSNGKITVLEGFKLTGQAIQGICTRIESPSMSYLRGMRDRMVERAAERSTLRHALANAQKGTKLPEGLTAEGVTAAIARITSAIHDDNAEIVQVLGYELTRDPSIMLKLRLREALGDCFACVSPTYGIADAPETVQEIIRSRCIPDGTRATWAYDPVSTGWELRFYLWTPTPVDMQAVGEPFEAHASAMSKDNGTSSVDTGGGITLLACLNAGTYVVDGRKGSRIHRGKVLRDVAKNLRHASEAMHVLCKAWGANRETEVALPVAKEGERKITINDAIPGFWRYLLKDTRGELHGVLPGRASAHVDGLTQAFHDERRDKSRLVRADFAQGWTRYIQGQASDVRRSGETAIASWLVKQGRIACEVGEGRK